VAETPAAACRNAVVIGVGSGAIGAALLVAPDRFGPMFGLSRPTDVRAVGLLDLALVPGLLAGRPRWPWAAARAAANLAIAAWCLHRTTNDGVHGARRSAAALIAVTVVDARLARDLYRGAA